VTDASRTAQTGHRSAASAAGGGAKSEIGGTVWQDQTVVRGYLTGVRGAIPGAAEQIDALLRVVAASGRPVRRLLDLGAGDGVLTAALLARYPGADATLVDFSAPMLQAAASRFAGATPPRLIDADFGQADWVAGVSDLAPFDVVVSGFAIHHLVDERKRGLYREIFDLLAPEGVFVNVEHVASPTTRLEDVFDELMIDALAAHERAAGGTRSRDEVAVEYRQRPDKAANLLASVEAQCRWLREIGFEDVDCYHKIFELAVFGGRKSGTPPKPGA